MKIKLVFTYDTDLDKAKIKLDDKFHQMDFMQKLDMLKDCYELIIDSYDCCIGRTESQSNKIH